MTHNNLVKGANVYCTEMLMSGVEWSILKKHHMSQLLHNELYTIIHKVLVVMRTIPVIVEDEAYLFNKLLL